MPDSSVLPDWFARVNPARLQVMTLYGSATDCAITRFGPGDRSQALFAGFVFDRRDLAASLGLDETCRDVDLLIAAWRRWREDLFDRLDGNYLACIWNAENEHFTLGRDAMGFYALYYSVHQKELWFGPNILALAQSGRIPRAFNRQSLALRLVNDSPAQGDTFFEGIHRIPPGHQLRWNLQQEPALVQFWDPLPDDEEPWLPDSQVLEEFEPRLQQAVDRCLQLEPNGITFSGGLDSTTIAALATHSTIHPDRPPLTAFSAVAPKGYAGDDGEPWQQPVTQYLGLPHRSSNALDRLGDRTLMEANLEEIPHLPAPTMVWWVGAFLGFYRSISQQGGRTLLTGNGADDWLGVPEWWTADLLRAGRLGSAAGFVRSHTGSGGRTWHYGLREMLWRRGLRTLAISHWARWAPGHQDKLIRQRLARSLPAWLCPNALDRERLIETLLSRRVSPLDPAGTLPRSYLRLLNRHSLQNPFISFERERNFHEERRVGLRLLHPFLDRRWVDFVSRIAPETLVFRGQYKGLLRSILQQHLPELGIETQRKGYGDPREDFLSQGLATSLPEIWASTRLQFLEDLSLVDSRHLPRDLSAGETTHGQRVRLFTLLSTEAWLAGRR